jgi:tetratricopeptide (TPR) repeat protein
MADTAYVAGQARMVGSAHKPTPLRTQRMLTTLIFGLLWASGGCGGSQVEQLDAKNYFLEAQEALKQGDATKAISAFTSSIESKPNAWAYMERAKLYAAAGQQDQALQDAQKAVELEPNNSDTHWLETELKKPAGQRFKGVFEIPPSARK